MSFSMPHVRLRYSTSAASGHSFEHLPPGCDSHLFNASSSSVPPISAVTGVVSAAASSSRPRSAAPFACALTSADIDIFFAFSSNRSTASVVTSLSSVCRLSASCQRCVNTRCLVASLISSSACLNLLLSFTRLWPTAG